MEDRLYLRQLLCGRDIAVDDANAAQMVNQVYLVGDRETGEAMIVDPAWAIDDLLGILDADGMRLTGALVTHHHPDHVGGGFMGLRVEGVAELLGRADVPVHANRHEARWVARTVGMDEADIRAHDGGDVVTVGGIEVTMLHTPGHTPGSQCFLVDGHLVAGDTLFLEGCGRTDLPGSDPEAMYESLQRLSALPDDTVILPGHRYSVASVGTLDAVRASNYVFKPASREAWLTMFAGGM